jgi:hypothetical protein
MAVPHERRLDPESTLTSSKGNSMYFHRRVVIAGVAAVWAVMVRATFGGPIPPEQFEYLHRLIKPQADESKWTRVTWLTNLDQARQRAVAQDKPLLLWRAGGGDVLGRA